MKDIMVKIPLSTLEMLLDTQTRFDIAVEYIKKEYKEGLMSPYAKELAPIMGFNLPESEEK